MVTDVRDAILRADVDGVAAVLAQDVVWIGTQPGQLCRSRAQVLDLFHRAVERGVSAKPEIVAELENMLVVDPHLDPPAEFNPELHQIYVLDEGAIVEMRDYPDRPSALEAVGLR